jgi:hypothetical protein
MHESHNPIEEWVQGTIQDLILNNVTTDWPVYNDEEKLDRDKKT